MEGEQRRARSRTRVQQAQGIPKVCVRQRDFAEVQCRKRKVKMAQGPNARSAIHKGATDRGYVVADGADSTRSSDRDHSGLHRLAMMCSAMVVTFLNTSRPCLGSVMRTP